MRAFLAVLAFAASIASSVAQGSLPACAVTCLTTADFGNCIPTDNACLCNNQAFVTSTTNCILSTCTGPDIETATAAARALCAAVGVTLTSTPAATGTAASRTTAPSSTAPASSGAASHATSSTAAAPSSTRSSGAVLHGANVVAGAIALGLGALAL